MVIIQVLDEFCKCAVGVVGISLALTLEVLFFCKIKELLI